MKATIEVPDELYRRVKAKTAMQGRAIREVTVELYQKWLDEGGQATLVQVKQPLVQDFRELPLLEGKPGSPKFALTAERIHELEMEAEMERHAASLR